MRRAKLWSMPVWIATEAAPRSRRRSLLAAWLVASLVALPMTLAADDPAEEAASDPPLSVDSITVEPENPGPDTLCRLRVQLRNRGSEIASQLDFSVKINGQELGVYSNQLFMYPIPAGASEEVQLYNFWTTETSRPMPKDGKLTVEVAHKGARWWEIKEDDEGVVVWTPLGDVEGLPVSTSVTLTMSR